MQKKDTILKTIQKPEDRLIISKALDKAELAAKTGKVVFTDFLDPYQQSLLAKVLPEYDEMEYVFDGGYTGAERAAAVFYPDSSISDEEDIRKDIFKVVFIKQNSRGSLSHRDYLGSLMGLGIRREKTGDIVVSEDQCSIIVQSDIAEYVSYNLVKVGNAGVSTEIRDIEELKAPEQKVREISVTVASMRLDCIAAPGFGISRGKASEFIKAGRLNLNWVMTQNPDKMVKEGDTISIRGKGRIAVEKVGGKTKRDRTGVVLKKFV